MDKLEKYVSENRGSFESGQPSADIWGKISEKRRSSPDGNKRFIQVLSRVAAVLIIFIVSYMIHEYRDFRRERMSMGLTGIYNQFPELREAKEYYNMLVSAKMREMGPFLKENPEIAGELKADIAELDSLYNSFQNDLKDNIDNEQIIEAMIHNYRLKLEILEILLEELQNDTKTTKDENGSMQI